MRKVFLYLVCFLLVSENIYSQSEDFYIKRIFPKKISEAVEMDVFKNSDLKIKYKDVTIHLKHTWTIARGSSNSKITGIVMIEKDGIIGYGEAALSTSSRFGETPETVREGITKIAELPDLDPLKYRWTSAYIDKNIEGFYAAKTAFDIAMYDYFGKYYKVPLYKMLGLNSEDTPLTSFSIAIDELDVIRKKVVEAQPYKILKVKLGADNDYDIIKTIRNITDKPIRVDANEGWTREEALEKIKWLSTQNVQFVEQPIPADDIEGIKWLNERTDMPIFADEALKTPEDLPKIASVYDGIVIKLVKCGGITPAFQLIETARTFGLKVMIGCMVATSVSITAAAHLTPLLDYADLDGNLLIGDDPFDGVKVKNGKLVLPNKPGLGVTPNEKFK